MVCVFLLALSRLALADSATLAWNPSGSDVAGYRLRYGTSSGIYTEAIDVGLALTVTVTNLVQGQTYYAVVTDYNVLGQESLPSNEVAFAPAVPSPLPVASTSQANPSSPTAPGSPTAPNATPPSPAKAAEIHSVRYSGDFQGNGNQDILWRDTKSGEVVVWWMDGFKVVGQQSLATVSLDWQIIGVGDFNGDGISDILWLNTADGSFCIWLMHGSGHDDYLFSSPGPDWTIAGVAAIDHAKSADILWRNTESGEVVIWRSQAPLDFASKSRIGVAGPDWALVGTADIFGDGNPVLVWRNKNTGAVVVWQIVENAIAVNCQIGSVPLTWQIAGLGDFTGRNKQDILWYSTQTGSVVLWLMNGVAFTQKWVSQESIPSEWQIEATPSNSDKGSSVLWSDTSTGQQVIWTPGNFSGTSAGTVDPEWIIQPTTDARN